MPMSDLLYRFLHDYQRLHYSKHGDRITLMGAEIKLYDSASDDVNIKDDGRLPKIFKSEHFSAGKQGKTL